MSSMFGGAADLYRNRFSTVADELNYDDDDYVFYPDVVRRKWMWHVPVGGANWSGSDYVAWSGAASGVSPRLQFNLPPMTVTDPTAYRVYFKCYVGDQANGGSGGTAYNGGAGPNSLTALCNYAHSVFNQVTVRFTGTASSAIEQVQLYNTFCSMFYQFYGTNYVQKFHNMLEGYSPISGGSNAARSWNGRSFCLPINVGFFITNRKYIPNFALPPIQIEFLMELNSRATCQKTSGVSTGANRGYYITQAMLVVSEVEVTNQYMDEFRQKVSEGQSMDKPIRLDFNSWTYMNFQVPSGTTGTFRNLLTGSFTGIRKVMFSQNPTVLTPFVAGQGSTAGGAPDTQANGQDAINSFVSGGLGSYRIQIGGRYFPDQEIWINNAAQSGTVATSTDLALAGFFNMFSVGTQGNTWSDFIQDWSPSDSFSGGYDSSNDFVFLLSTSTDECGMPVVSDMLMNGPLALILNYAIAAPYALSINVFVNVHRCIYLNDGNRIQFIEG